MIAAIDASRPPRSIHDLEQAAAGNGVGGNGDLGGTFTSAERTPFAAAGRSDTERGRAALERMLADTAVGAQIQDDEFELIRHDNGRYTLVLPGVIDLSHPHWGLDADSRSVRDVDQFALPSSADARVASNRYAQMVREVVLDHVPRGAEVMIVGHSFGADTALDLAADPQFNNAFSGVNVTHVVAAAYFNQPQLGHVPARTQVLVLQNANDAAVIGEGIGWTATEVRDALARRTLPWPDALDLLRTGVERPDAHTVLARFDGGREGVGHHQQNYIDYLNTSNDPAVRGFVESVARAGYTAPGSSHAVDVSVNDPGYRTTYPGQRFVDQAAAARDWLRDGAVSLWNRLPGHDTVESAVDRVADHLPFNNAAGAALQALAGAQTITLDADATEAIQRDPDFVRTEADLVARIRALPGYGERPLTVDLQTLRPGLGVELGGQRGAGSMGDQLRRAWDLSDPEIRATWQVAGNELTWLLRHARLDGTANVSADGRITIDYRISDTLDLRPGAGRSDAYNAVTTVMGTLWHDVLGAEEAQVSGRFTRTMH